MFRIPHSMVDMFGRRSSRSEANQASRRRKRRTRRIAGLEWLEQRTLLSTYIVTSNLDTDASGTLRWAVLQADAAASPSTIELDTSTATITLTQGQLELSNAAEPITIDGPGPSLLSISGNHASRVFQVDSGVTATISGLTITGGSTSGFGGGLYSENLSVLVLKDCTISGNSAGHGGGLLSNYASAALEYCTIYGNSASGKGGALDNYGGDLALNDCTISGNTASSVGGIIAGLNGSHSKPKTYLYNTTVADNSAASGVAGLYNQGTAKLDDTIVAGNDAGSTPGDIGGNSGVTGSYNLIGTGGSGGISNSNGFTGNIVLTTSTEYSASNPAGLGSLGDYGGPTPTIPLLAGSPAIGKGIGIGGFTADQRGLPLDSPNPDIGAFQTSPLVVNTTIDGTGSPSGDLSLRQAVNLANVLDAAESITFSPTVFATAQTITLDGSQLTLSETGGPITITGPAADLTISGNHSSRVFQIDIHVTAIIFGLTISGGSASAGGGVFADLATLTLTDCTISGNTASQAGGGISNVAGALTLIDSTVSGNSATNYGGGLFDNGGAVTLTDVTVDGNTAESSAGLDLFGGTNTLIQCTVSDNADTIARTGFVAGMYVYASGTNTLTDTIVAGNTDPSGPSDIGGDGTVEGSYNLIGTGGSGGLANGSNGNIVLESLTGLDFGPLGNYGGPTETIPLLLGSPAIGAGIAVSGITTDQRGMPRDSPKPDIGAFQTQSSYALIVQTTNDGGAPAGEFDLRGAIDMADLLGGSQTITFSPTVFATPEAITLTAGQLVLSAGTVTITGPAAGVTISGGGSSRVFQINSGVTASISGLTITGGSATYGGGLDILGDATLTNCTISGNTASEGGGGLNNFRETTTLIDCTLVSNTAGNFGGAIDNDGAGAALNVSDCTIASNTTSGSGGGIEAQGTVTVTACTFTLNTAHIAGAIDDYDGLYSVTVEDSILAGDAAPGGGPEFDETVHSGGYNLVSNIAGSSGWNSSDITGQSADLGPLGDYGGLTETIPLLPGSPAVGAGSSSSSIPGVTLPSTDQRGLLRGNTVDIGAFQTSLVVESVSGSVNTSGSNLTLPGAVSLADQYAGLAITFDPTAFATPRTITLSGVQLTLSDTGGPTTITGPAAGLTLSGNNASRVFQIDSGVTATISGLTISGGATSGYGGGVYNKGVVTITDCTITGNDCSGDESYGGGVDNTGTATFTDCTISGNTASLAGGVYNTLTGTATLTDCTISGNTAAYGGGMANNGTATLTDCTISGNTATTGFGGGIFNLDSGGLLSLADCTIASNSAGRYGGGLAAMGPVTVTACTFTLNSAGSGGGAIYHFSDQSVQVDDSILSGDSSSGGPEFSGQANSLGHNLVSDISGSSGWVSSDITGQSADLGPLGDYGGPTETIPLLPASPAIGAGIGVSGITTDQRGMPLDSPNPDIGAFQANPPVATTTSVTSNTDTITYGQSATFTATVTSAFGAPPDGSVQFFVNSEAYGSPVVLSDGGTARMAIAEPVGTFTVTAQYTGDTYFAAALPGVEIAAGLTVDQAALTITASPESKTYGQALSFGSGRTEFTSSGLQNGETIASVTLNVTDNGGAATASVGGYTITPSAATGGTFNPSNYSITYDTGTLTVTAAPLTITASPESKTYGQALSFGSGSTQFTPSGLQNGETIASVTLSVSSNGGAANASVGGYTITPSAATGGTFNPSNYSIIYDTGTLTVNAAPLTITASPESKTYGQALSFGSGSTQFTPSGLQNGETIASVTLSVTDNGGAATASVGGYTITPSAATGGTFNPSNYSITYDTGTLTVTAAPLTITASPESKTYGQALSFGSGSTQFTPSGLQNGETIGSVTLSDGGGAANASVGGYTITPSAATGGTFNPSNYSITYDTGTLTVNAAPLTITASPESKTYGQTLGGSGSTEFTSSALQNGETIGSVTLSGGGGAATAPVGGYTITPSAATGGTFNPSNYSITYDTGTLTVNAAPLTITASPESKTYGQTLGGSGSTQFTPSGLQNGETIGSVTLSVSGNGGAANASVGGYTITPSAATGGTFNPGNYSISYDTGTLTVNQVATTTAVTPNTDTVSSGQSATFTATVSSTAGAPPDGSVQFLVNDVAFGSPVALSGGEARIAITEPVGSFTVKARYTGDTDLAATLPGAQTAGTLVVNSPTPTPTPTPSPTPTPTQTVIVSEQPLFERKLNKKGKPTGKPVLTGFMLDYGVPLGSVVASNYQLDTVTTKKVKRHKEPIPRPFAKFTVSYLPMSDEVEIVLGAKETFPTGGQLTVLGGQSTAAGGTLTGSAVFTISKGGKNIGPA